MSDFENKNGMTAGEETVDDILAGILNPDGSFNDEFNGLLKKYVGGDTTGTVISAVDISDRRDEANVSSRVEYEAEADISFASVKNANERIEEKIPESVRTVYAEASAQAQRPEFTSTGDVKYPTMGVGAAEERVVYDADWEETAKKEAARLERVRQDRMLRGDSAYARTFTQGGAYLPRKSIYVDAPASNSEYIDPLSRDDDFEGETADSQYYSSSKKSFFPEGFSATQRNNSASGGKTERVRGGNMSNGRHGTVNSSSASWLQVEEKPVKKKKSLFGKKKSNAGELIGKITVDEDITGENAVYGDNKDGGSSDRERVSPFTGEDMASVEKETEGLRSTVAEIVDKYKKRSEEDERRRIEEQARLEDERREEELRERRRLEEIRVLKQHMSPELFEAVESEESEEAFDEYEDFSTEPAEKKEEKPKKTFGVVFDPTVFEKDTDKGREFTEKISFTEESVDTVIREENEFEENTAVSDSRKKKIGILSRRKDS